MNNSHLSKDKINLFIILSFVIFALLNSLIMIIGHSMPLGYDINFHWQRIEELIKSTSYFPRLSLNSFAYSGSATPTFYPYLFLYPYVLIFHMIHSITDVTYIMFTLNTIISLIISYYSSLILIHRRNVSYIFSVTYSISYYFFINVFQVYGMGMFYSFIFMPLVLLGFMQWLKTGKWIMLSLGMILIIYSSVIVPSFTLPILIVWLLFNYKNIDIHKFMNLMKAAGITLLVSSMVWLPILKLFLLNNIQRPKLHFPLQGVNIIKSMISALIPFAATTYGSSFYLMTLYSLLGLIIGILFYKKLPLFIKQSFIISIIVLIVVSKIIPWQLFKHTFLNTIQYPWRMYLIPQVLLTYIFSIIICKLLYSNIYKPKNKVLSIFFLIIIVFLFQFSYQSTFLERTGRNSIPPNSSIMNKDITNKFNVFDYYPKQAAKSHKYIINHIGRYNKNNHIRNVRFKPLSNGRFIVNLHNNVKKISMPFIYYNGYKYNCFDNNKQIKVTHCNNLLLVNHIHKGINHIHVKVSIDRLTIISRILTILGVMIYLYVIKVKTTRFIHKM